MSVLANISVVLVEPSHPGNIGAAARAIKTMGLHALSLVNPGLFPHREASRRAAGAEDVLDRVQLFDQLDTAVQDQSLVFGASVRDREVSWPVVSPRVAARQAKSHLAAHDSHRVAIVFGREDRGLTNQELECCTAQIFIDANPDYSSLNLASAVQLITYEMRLALVNNQYSDVAISSASRQRQQAASQLQKQGHLQHLTELLEELQFAHNQNSPLLMRKLTRLYNKADLTIEEIQILRGILNAMQSRLSRS